MIDINDNNNMCKTALKYKQRRYEPKQLSLFFNEDMDSHNICFSKSPKLSNSLHRFEQSNRTARTSKFDCLENDNLLTTNLQRNPMILINGKKGLAKKVAGDKQRFYRTNQLKSKQIDNSTSHNIYFTNLFKSSDTLQKPEETKRTVRFNKLGSLKILTVQLNKIKSYYKDISGTYIELYGVDKPIALRESLAEIKNIINRSKKW
ncbi:MAG: hypothetical protein CMA63_02670 [Euryarchaeota archaeon]|nr:hypothetical protein [Euryarchaeota archaeon]|tara:strand:+ start:2184 stop:2798 length:615 start_codon:yes stop_codon:yes gene_type:complete